LNEPVTGCVGERASERAPESEAGLAPESEAGRETDLMDPLSATGVADELAGNTVDITLYYSATGNW